MCQPYIESAVALSDTYIWTPTPITLHQLARGNNYKGGKQSESVLS